MSPSEPLGEAPAFDRTITPVSGKLGSAWPGKRMLVAGALLGGCALLLIAGWRSGDQAPPPKRPQQPPREVVAFEPLAPAAAPSSVDAETSSTLLAPEAPAVPALQAEARPLPAATLGGSAPLVVYRAGEGRGPAAELAQTLSAASPAGDEFERLKRTSSVPRVRAEPLGDRNALILAGALLPCVLQTAIDSATPGHVSCLLSQDALSESGAVVLMEKGTKILGEYRQGLRAGQRRLFVLWTRAVTPTGVAVSLASPAADDLGRAGFDGRLDNRFWDRFGGALLLSVVDDGLAASGDAPALGTVRAPSQAAAVALQGSLDIPPSLTKPQGALVSIFVAQDLDFSGVYRLTAP